MIASTGADARLLQKEIRNVYKRITRVDEMGRTLTDKRAWLWELILALCYVRE